MSVQEVQAFVAGLASADFKPAIVDKAIDGINYRSQKWPASLGLELWPKTVTLFGPALKPIVTGETSDDIWLATLVRVSERASAPGFADYVKAILSRTAASEVRTIGAGAVIDGFDEHFAGEYMHLLKVCLFVLSHNLRGPTFGASSMSGAPVPPPPPSEDPTEGSSCETSTPQSETSVLDPRVE